MNQRCHNDFERAQQLYTYIYIHICVIGVMISHYTWEVGPVQQLNPPNSLLKLLQPHGDGKQL